MFSHANSSGWRALDGMAWYGMALSLSLLDHAVGVDDKFLGDSLVKVQIALCNESETDEYQH